MGALRVGGGGWGVFRGANSLQARIEPYFYVISPFLSKSHADFVKFYFLKLQNTAQFSFIFNVFLRHIEDWNTV